MAYPDPPHAVLEHSRQVRHQAGLWRWLAKDTCQASQRLWEQTRQLLATSQEVTAEHATLCQEGRVSRQAAPIVPLGT